MTNKDLQIMLEIAEKRGIEQGINIIKQKMMLGIVIMCLLQVAKAADKEIERREK